MTKSKSNPKPKKKSIVVIFVILFFSCASLIIINYITIRILSASRAYVNGESNYSKGQNKASRHLITYLYTEDNNSWKLFNQEINIPLGDKFARIALTNKLNDSIVKIGFRAGKNKEEDLDDLIWVFKYFNTVPFLKEAIVKWQTGDKLIDELHSMGVSIHKKINTEKLDRQTKDKMAYKISILCDKLSVAADRFSDVVGDGTRKIKNNLIAVNILFILIIISCISMYYAITLKRITNSEKDLNSKKEQLHTIVQDLEKTKIELSTEIVQHKKLIGTISHDIKSPLKYLTMTSKYIYEESKNFEDEKIKKNTKSIYSSTLQLFNFIDSLLTYSKLFFEGRVSENEEYKLRELVDTKCNLFNDIAKASNNKLLNEIDPEIKTKINRDILSAILHNILDNAIKNTDSGVIKINSLVENKKLYITIEDTGIGFKTEDLIYYNQLIKENSTEKLILKNSGTGIPMTIELIHIIHGDLKISNKDEKGTKIEIITDIV